MLFAEAGIRSHDMITHYRNRALTRISLGLLMFGLLGLLLALKRFGIPEIIVVLGGILLSTSGIILYVRGCVALAEAKGHAGGVVVAAIILSALCVPGVILLLPIVLALALEDRNKHSRGVIGPRRKSHRHQYGSNLERIVHYRRNALVGIYFGLGGVALGIFLVIFRVGIFSDHSNEAVLGMLIFLIGYCAVLAGCWWWLRAKALNEALVFIGLMPLAIPFVPFVRLILLTAPAIIPLGMIMMPLILIVVVWVLPDQSERSRRKSWWE